MVVEATDPPPLRDQVDACEPPDRASYRRWWHVALLVVPTVLLLVLGYSRRFMSDDGLIFTRSVRQILAGNGPVLSPGERAETATSTLWQWLLVLVTWVTHVDPARVAVFGGLVLSGAGFLLALTGTSRLHLQRPKNGQRVQEHAGAQEVNQDEEQDGDGLRSRTRLLIPAGVLILLVLPPVWDFATSGLETGLVTFWIGLSWWLLVGARTAEPELRVSQRRYGLLTAFVLGLGPLVRPDLTVTAGIFLALLIYLYSPRRPRVIAGQVAAAAALPVAYEIFRMGYYGLLVPLPAVTKEAGASEWSRGWLYLSDFLVPSWLWVVLPLVAALLVAVVRRNDGPREKFLILAPMTAGAAMTLFVVRVGGDWMQARMLLPALFLLLLPILLVPYSRRVGGAWLLVLVWVLAAASPLRTTAEAHSFHDMNLRRSMQALTGRQHPMDGIDFARVARPYEDAMNQAAGRPVVMVPSVFYGDERLFPVPLAPNGRLPHDRPVYVVGYLGAAGAVVPLDEPLLDQLSLGYPLGAHMELKRLDWPGHEKLVENTWVLADYAAPGALPGGPQAPDLTEPTVAAARHALSCGDLRELQQSVREPLTVGRFVSNLTGSIRRTSLRVPRDPFEAERTFCGH